MNLPNQPNQPNYEQIAQNVQRQQQMLNQVTFNKRPIKCKNCGCQLFHPPIVTEIWKDKHHIIGQTPQLAMLQKPNQRNLYCVDCGKAVERSQLDPKNLDDDKKEANKDHEQNPNKNTENTPNEHEQNPNNDTENTPNTNENTEK